MPKTRLARSVRLEFEPGALVHANLSGAAFADPAGDWLFVAGDEASAVDRLRRLPPVAGETLRYGAGREFPLAGLLELPGAADEEADLEGMVFHGGWLWVVGSHGLKRRNAKPGRDDAENAKRLARVSLDANRRLLARIPVEPDADGAPTPVREARDGRRAQRLHGNARDNALTRALAEDDHLAPFLAIPGKDNGFDVEGLALLGQGDALQVLLGLRGPVLRGWALLLELALREKDGELRLAPLGAGGPLLRKHFLPLEGLGVRDLHVQGADLHALAGPTMVLDGDVRVFRWTGGADVLRAAQGPACVHAPLAQSVALPHARGCNRAEALTALPEALARALGDAAHWLVLYDAPGPDRRDGEHTVFGDLLR